MISKSPVVMQMNKEESSFSSLNAALQARTWKFGSNVTAAVLHLEMREENN